MRVAFASDHAGFDLKQELLAYVAGLGYETIDLGTTDTSSVDWSDFGAAIGHFVVAGDADRGIAVCGSGIGICIAANKVRGAVAATVGDVTGARLCRAHNDATIMCLGQRFTGIQVATDAVDAFLSTDFEGGRHARRVDKLAVIEAE